MVAAHGVLLSTFMLLVPCFTDSITAPARLLQDEDVPLQHPLGIETHDSYASNATVTADTYDSVYLPISQSKQRIRAPRALYDPLQKRDNYCFANAPSAFCADSNLCCTDTALDTGWCCWFTLNCGVEDHNCITPTVVFTSTSTITSQHSLYITLYATSYGTSTVTETVTSTNVVTATNVATATKVEVTTITAQGANKARGILQTDIASPESTPSPFVLSTSHDCQSITRGDREAVEQNPITVFFEPSSGLARRQAITTTDIVYTTVYVTTTISTLLVIDSTDYVTSTATEQVTTTLALNAQTTVHVTSTYTVSSTSSTDAATSSTASASTGAGRAISSHDNSTDGGGGGLGGGAVAGIAVGAAAGALIVAGIVAFCMYKHRKKRRAEALAAGPVQRDSGMFSPASDTHHSDKMAPAAAYDPRSSHMAYQHDYHAVPGVTDQQVYHEADGRMVGWQQMHEMQHPPAELAANQRYGMDNTELPRDRR